MQRRVLEVAYVGLCFVVLLASGGTTWFYLFVALTLPWSAGVFALVAFAWGGLPLVVGDAVGIAFSDAWVTALWMVCPLANVIAVEWICQRRARRARTA